MAELAWTLQPHAGCLSLFLADFQSIYGCWFGYDEEAEGAVIDEEAEGSGFDIAGMVRHQDGGNYGAFLVMEIKPNQ